MEALTKADILIETPCGGKGICGKCKILIKSGITNLSELEKKLISPQEIEKGFRLACQTRIFYPCEIKIPSEIRLNLQPVLSPLQKGERKGYKKNFPLEPETEKFFLVLAKPVLNDQRSDWERILEELSKRRGKNYSAPQISLSLLKKIPSLIREADFKITITICHNEIIAVEKGDTTSKMYGIAFDVGTTTVVGYLIDLKNGKEISVGVRTNSQIIYGDNIISRIEFTQRAKNGQSLLQKEIVDTINDIIQEITKHTQINQKDIYEIVVVGNTCMQHLFLGLDPVNLALSPYISVSREEFYLKAKEISGLLLEPETKVYLPSNISAFVGSDILAGIVFNSIWRKNRTSLLIDLGTNGEIVLSLKGELWTCSTAAGPAWEGVRIAFGMRAVDGAINKVEINKRRINCHTIGGIKAKGICGSGIIDLVSEMLKIGLIDRSGRIVDREECPAEISQEIKNRIIKEKGEKRFLLVKSNGKEENKEIYFTQKDIREVQVAKAALQAGIKILFKEVGISAKDIQEIFLAGAFGNFINKQSALRIGILPDLPLNRIKSVGNAAGKGAELILCSQKIRKIGNEIYKKVKYVELSSHPDFSRDFIEAMSF
ncbi:MAG: ASKHA domain-containing protein [Candidatus Caldatribacteriota bacterium]